MVRKIIEGTDVFWQYSFICQNLVEQFFSKAKLLLQTFLKIFGLKKFVFVGAVTNSFEKILISLKRKPNLIESDRGKELFKILSKFP